MVSVLEKIIQNCTALITGISARINALSRLKLLLYLISAAVIFAFLTSQFVEKSGDAVYKWGILRHYVELGAWYPPFPDHHQGRWALNLPVIMLMKIFGTSIWVYYLYPFASGIIAGLFTYAVTAKISSRTAGAAAFLIFQIFPLTARGHTQFLPMLPATMFILIALYFILRWLDSRQLPDIAVAGIMIVLAYGCKITSLYWALALVSALGLYSTETRVRFRFFRLKIGAAFSLFSAVVAGGLIIETLIINRLCGFSGGRLQLIAGSHLSAQPDPEYCGFFTWLLSFFRPLSLHGKYFESMPCFFIFLLGLTSAVFCLWAGSVKKRLAAFSLIAVYLLQCYMVYRVFPFLHPEQALSRYFLPVAVVGIILYCASAAEWNRLVWSRFRRPLVPALLKLVLCLVWLIPALIYIGNSWWRNGTVLDAARGNRLFAAAGLKQLPVLLKLENRTENSRLSSSDRKNVLRWMTFFGPARLIPELSEKIFSGAVDAAGRKYLLLLNAGQLKTQPEIVLIDQVKITEAPNSMTGSAAEFRLE
ncbi:MAG: glycosyltransferase family 39 protein [Victivallaceae bacterium]|nr:glycosyltransferase family 39 protein [Victivallaceae bacterium]